MSPMPSLYIYIYVYMWYVLYHLSQVAVITPTDAGRRICETQLRRSLCSRVAKTAGMDSRNVLWKATYLAFDSYLHIWSYLDIAIRVSYPASKVLLCRVIGGNVNYTDEVTPDPEASFWGKYVFSCLHQSCVLLGLFVSLGGHANINFSLPGAVLLLRRWYILASKGHLTRSVEIGRKHAVRIGRMWTISVTQRQVFCICISGIPGLLSLPIQGIRALRLWRCLRRIRLTLSWHICACLLSHLFLLLNLLDLKLTCQGTELHICLPQFGSVRSVQAAAVPLCL